MIRATWKDLVGQTTARRRARSCVEPEEYSSGFDTLTMSWNLWLDCLSEQQIAEQTGLTQTTIHTWIEEKRADLKFSQPPGASQDTPWGNVRHFDIWQFATANGNNKHFGKMPPQVVENLLWFFTEPGDIVVDPFAGGGTTIDVAKVMGRRIWASDLVPSNPMLPIHRHNILAGWPDDAPTKAKLVLLDPPYWQQAKGRYSNEIVDLGNMDLMSFYNAWAKIIQVCRSHITDDGYIAYIISPTQYNDGTVIDHATDMLSVCVKVGLSVRRRIIVPYQTQQATGQQVTWAREKKKMLKLYRDLIVLSQ